MKRIWISMMVPLAAPSVTASVIYAEKIKAGSVTADNIYVKDVERR